MKPYYEDDNIETTIQQDPRPYINSLGELDPGENNPYRPDPSHNLIDAVHSDEDMNVRLTFTNEPIKIIPYINPPRKKKKEPQKQYNKKDKDNRSNNPSILELPTSRANKGGFQPTTKPTIDNSTTQESPAATALNGALIQGSPNASTHTKQQESWIEGRSEKKIRTLVELQRSAHIDTKENIAAILTKFVDKATFYRLSKKVISRVPVEISEDE